MTAQIMNLDQWLELTGDEISGDELAPSTMSDMGSLWQRAAEGTKP